MIVAKSSLSQVLASQVAMDSRGLILSSRSGFPLLGQRKHSKIAVDFPRLPERRLEIARLPTSDHRKPVDFRRWLPIQVLQVEQVFHMKGGDGETSYARNSRLQVNLYSEPSPFKCTDYHKFIHRIEAN